MGKRKGPEAEVGGRVRDAVEAEFWIVLDNKFYIGAGICLPIVWMVW